MIISLLLGFALASDTGPPPPPRDLSRARPRPIPAQSAAPAPDRPGGTRTTVDDEILMRITRRVRLEELEVRSSRLPVFPEGTRGIEAHDCEMRLFIDASGAPLRALPLSCDAAFAETSEDALLGWRFAPYEVHGDAVPVSTDVVVEYRR